MMLNDLLKTLSEFVFNETGLVRQGRALSVAWVAGLLVAGAVFLGTPNQAAAHCSGSHWYFCYSNSMCDAYCMHHGGGSCYGECYVLVCVCGSP